MAAVSQQEELEALDQAKYGAFKELAWGRIMEVDWDDMDAREEFLYGDEPGETARYEEYQLEPRDPWKYDPLFILYQSRMGTPAGYNRAKVAYDTVLWATQDLHYDLSDSKRLTVQYYILEKMLLSVGHTESGEFQGYTDNVELHYPDVDPPVNHDDVRIEDIRSIMSIPESSDSDTAGAAGAYRPPSPSELAARDVLAEATETGNISLADIYAAHGARRPRDTLHRRRTTRKEKLDEDAQLEKEIAEGVAKLYKRSRSPAAEGHTPSPSGAAARSRTGPSPSPEKKLSPGLLLFQESLSPHRAPRVADAEQIGRAKYERLIRKTHKDSPQDKLTALQDIVMAKSAPGPYEDFVSAVKTTRARDGRRKANAEDILQRFIYLGGKRSLRAAAARAPAAPVAPVAPEASAARDTTLSLASRALASKAAKAAKLAEYERERALAAAISDRQFEISQVNKLIGIANEGYRRSEGRAAKAAFHQAKVKELTARYKKVSEGDNTEHFERELGNTKKLLDAFKGLGSSLAPSHVELKF